MEHLVVIAESFQSQAADVVDVLKGEVEITHQEIGEIEACHLKEQLVLVDRVGLIGNEEDEFGIALWFKDAGGNGVAVGKHITAAVPDVAHVKLSAVEPASGLHTVDNHSGHLADFACGVFFYYSLHIRETALTVAAIQFVQTADE